MKRLYIIPAVVVIVLAGIITSTIVIPGTNDESKVEVPVDEKVAEVATSAESIDIVSSWSDLTTEEVMAVYPGFLNFVRTPRLQDVDISTEEVMAIYPGYLDSLKESRTPAVNTGTGEIMAIYPGYLDSLKASQTQTFEDTLRQLPFVPGIYFHP